MSWRLGEFRRIGNHNSLPVKFAQPFGEFPRGTGDDIGDADSLHIMHTLKMIITDINNQHATPCLDPLHVHKLMRLRLRKNQSIGR